MAFIDLAGFTRLTQELGDASAVSSATRLAELATDSARRHGGRLVKLLGDGVMLHFSTPADAIRASLEIVALLGAAGLPEAHVGIAAGPLIARDGDYFGHTVNLAARLSARATDGRVLVNDLVVEAVGDAADIRLTPAGEQELKGLSSPVAAWWADLVASG
jgi:adenylate cyclase